MLDTPSKLRILSEQRELADDEAIPLLTALGFVRRHKTVILTCLLVSLGLAGMYLIIAPNRFTATAQLLTDTKRSDSPAAQYGLVDAAVVDSQVETIKSEKIAIAVINKLHLTQDPEFSDSGILGRLLSAVSFRRTMLLLNRSNCAKPWSSSNGPLRFCELDAATSRIYCSRPKIPRGRPKSRMRSQTRISKISLTQRP